MLRNNADMSPKSALLVSNWVNVHFPYFLPFLDSKMHNLLHFNNAEIVF